MSTTLINIDYYNELKAKADLYDALWVLLKKRPELLEAFGDDIFGLMYLK